MEMNPNELKKFIEENSPVEGLHGMGKGHDPELDYEGSEEFGEELYDNLFD